MLRAVEPPHLGRARPPVVELDALAQPAAHRRSAAPDLDLVDLLDPVARMREPVREITVVRQQQRAGRVRVEPPDGHDPRR